MEYNKNKDKINKTKKYNQLSSTIQKIKKENQKEISQIYNTTRDNENIKSII